MGHSLGEASMNLHQSPPGKAQEHTHFLQQQVVTHVKCCLPGCLSETEHQALLGLVTEAPSALHMLELQTPRGEQVFHMHSVVQCRHSGPYLSPREPWEGSGCQVPRHQPWAAWQADLSKESSQLAMLTLFCTLCYVHALFENIIFPRYRNSACTLLGKLQNADWQRKKFKNKV